MHWPDLWQRRFLHTGSLGTSMNNIFNWFSTILTVRLPPEGPNDGVNGAINQLSTLNRPKNMHLSTSNAISFCQSSTAAAVLTVWPSGGTCLNEVHNWLDSTNGVNVVHSSEVSLTTFESELLTVMALYDGEDWLETNCWYNEQPLPDGPPEGPYAGAKWKHALCFQQPDAPSTKIVPTVIVLEIDQSQASSLWSSKYQVRSRLARLSGNPGNSCIHLTDRQDKSILRQYQDTASRPSSSSGNSMACDSSYAYTCARALLHPASVEWLNSGANGLARCKTLGSEEFRTAWKVYTDWLQSPEEEDPPFLKL